MPHRASTRSASARPAADRQATDNGRKRPRGGGSANGSGPPSPRRKMRRSSEDGGETVAVSDSEEAERPPEVAIPDFRSGGSDTEWSAAPSNAPDSPPQDDDDNEPPQQHEAASERRAALPRGRRALPHGFSTRRRPLRLLRRRPYRRPTRALRQEALEPPAGPREHIALRVAARPKGGVRVGRPRNSARCTSAQSERVRSRFQPGLKRSGGGSSMSRGRRGRWCTDRRVRVW